MVNKIWTKPDWISAARGNGIRQAASSFVATLMLAAASVQPVAADDIDIYLQAPAADDNPPLVVLALDLNLDPTQIVCSNVLADPSTLVGEPLCESLQQVAVLPVLEEIVGLEIGSLVDLLAGSNSIAGGLLGLVGDLSGVSLSNLADALDGITGAAGGDEVVPLTQLDVVRLLVYRVLHQLVGVRLSIMVNNASTCATGEFATPRSATTGCSNGAFVLLHATELLEDSISDTVDNVLLRLGSVDIATLDPDADPTPAFQGKELYYELLRYLTGGAVYNAGLNAENGLPATPDPNAVNAAGLYHSPLVEGACEQIHVINIMFTDSQDDDESDADILADPALAGANTDGGTFEWAEMISHLASTGIAYNGGNYRLSSSFLVNGLEGGVGGLLSNLTGTVMNLPIAINPLAVDFARSETFIPVPATSATFGGPQPVFRLSDRGTADEPLYTGYFRPDADRKPAWRGNLKRLALTAAGDGTLRIEDALGLPAVDALGDIRNEALTFWTSAADLPTGVEGTLDGRDGNTVDRGGAGMNLIPPFVEPSPYNPPAGTLGSTAAGGPVVYYQQGSDSAGELNIGNLNIDDATVNEAGPAFEVSNRLEVAQLIAFARGYQTQADVLGGEGYGGFLGFLNNLVGGLTTLIKTALEDLFEALFCSDILGLLGVVLGTECKVPDAVAPESVEWVMGDVLHSHPLPIDYGGNTGIRIFTGTNLGLLHQFRDQAGSGDSFAGQEVWRFAPRQTLRYMKQWRSNTAIAASRPYGVDGAAVAWVSDADGDGRITPDSDDRVYLFFGLRRGGKAYYALDVTNPDARPTGLWQIDNSQPEFAELGLSFSNPRFTRLRLDNDSGSVDERRVLIFGGGYNGGYTSAGNALGKDARRGSDFDENSPATSSGNAALVGANDDQGNALFVIDADTGALLWKARKGSSTTATSAHGVAVYEHADLVDGIASDVSVVDISGDGFADRVYVGDTGGKIWRADIGSSDRADWLIHPIASLGRHASSGSATVPNDRRFFHRPDVVRVKGAEKSFFAIVIGSGNQADPLNRHTDNFLFVIKDQNLLDPEAEAVVPGDLADFDSNCAAGSCDSLINPAFSAAGWKIQLGPGTGNERAGEKALSSPFTVGGKVLFTSYVPAGSDVSACTPQEGRGRLYALDLRTGEPVVTAFSEDGEASGVDYARSSWLSAAGIPATVNYVRAQQFLSSDFGLTTIDHASSWRTYWRERFGEH